MQTNTTNEKAHGCDPVGFKNYTNLSNSPTRECERKAFATLAARFALAGHALMRSDPASGAVIYQVGSWGQSRAVPDLQAAALFLAQIGGANV